MATLLRLLGFLLLSSSAIAAAECPIDYDADVDFDDEVYGLVHPGCRDQAEKIAARLEAGLAAGIAAGEVDAEEVAYARMLLDMHRVRGLLAKRDIWQAREALALLKRGDPDEEMRELLAESLDPTIAVLDGRAAPPFTVGAIAAEPDWYLQPMRCGMPAMSFYLFGGLAPSVADAWFARGRSDYAVSAVLASEWTKGLSLGMAPPQLQEHVEKFLGPGSYRREVEMALKAIRIEKRIDGMYATLPIFGHTLPLPLGRKSRDGESETYDTPAELAEFVRPMLLDAE